MCKFLHNYFTKNFHVYKCIIVNMNSQMYNYRIRFLTLDFCKIFFSYNSPQNLAPIYIRR